MFVLPNNHLTSSVRPLWNKGSGNLQEHESHIEGVRLQVDRHTSSKEQDAPNHAMSCYIAVPGGRSPDTPAKEKRRPMAQGVQPQVASSAHISAQLAVISSVPTRVPVRNCTVTTMSVVALIDSLKPEADQRNEDFYNAVKEA